MPPESKPSNHLVNWNGYQCHLGQLYALGLSLLICMVLLLIELDSSPMVQWSLFSLALANLLANIWSIVVLKSKEQKTYTESQTTIVPPADPLDVISGVPDLLWTIDYASRRVTSHNQAHIAHHPTGGQFAKLATIFPARVSRQYLETLIELQNTQRPTRFEYTLGNEQQQFTFEARLTPLSQRDCVVVIRDISHIKATEAALFKQQLFTQQIIDSSPNLIFIRDRHARFLLVNQATQTLLGHDLLVHSHMGFDEDTPVLSAGDEEVFATGATLRRIDSCVLANGRTHWFDITKLAIEREGKSYILSIAIDITAQKENEAAQHHGSLLIRAMAHALPHGFVLVQQDQIQFANQAACKRLGYAPEQLIGEPFTLLKRDNSTSETQQDLHICGAQGEKIRCDLRQLDADSGSGQLLTLH
jgi:PAS domain-containing protein